VGPLTAVEVAGCPGTGLVGTARAGAPGAEPDVVAASVLLLGAPPPPWRAAGGRSLSVLLCLQWGFLRPLIVLLTRTTRGPFCFFFFFATMGWVGTAAGVVFFGGRWGSVRKRRWIADDQYHRFWDLLWERADTVGRAGCFAVGGGGGLCGGGSPVVTRRSCGLGSGEPFGLFKAGPPDWWACGLGSAQRAAGACIRAKCQDVRVIQVPSRGKRAGYWRVVRVRSGCVVRLGLVALDVGAMPAMWCSTVFRRDEELVADLFVGSFLAGRGGHFLFAGSTAFR